MPGLRPFVKTEHPASPAFAEATEGYAGTSPPSLALRRDKAEVKQARGQQSCPPYPALAKLAIGDRITRKVGGGSRPEAIRQIPAYTPLAIIWVRHEYL